MVGDSNVFSISFIYRIIREFEVEYRYGPLKYKTSIILSPDEDLKFKFTDTIQ